MSVARQVIAALPWRLRALLPNRYAITSVLIDLCTQCPLRCVYCLHQRRKLVPAQAISPEDMYTILDILAREHFTLVHLYMSGEPFVHEHIYDFIAKVATCGMTSSTGTKLAIDIDFEKLDQALTVCDTTGHKARFLFTIDTFDPIAAKKIAPGIRVDRVIANLSRFKELAKTHTCVEVAINTVVNRYNENDLQTIRNTLNSLGYTHWAPKQMGYYMPYHATEGDIETIMAALPLSAHHSPRFTIDNGAIVSRRRHCLTNALEPAISANGDVTICCHDMLHTLKLGNILQTGSMRAIIATRRFRQIQAQAMSMSLDICKGCN